MMIIKTELDDETVITGLGTLEWNLRESAIVIPSHFADMRPTIEKDLQGEKLETRQSNNFHFIKDEDDEARKRRFTQELIYVTVLLIQELKSNNVIGKVLFCYAHKILHWDQQIQCSVYKSVEVN